MHNIFRKNRHDLSPKQSMKSSPYRPTVKCGWGDFHINWYYITGGALALIFLSLLSFRLGFFQEYMVANRNADISGTSVEMSQIPSHSKRESWMAISQEGRKVGYAHRQLLSTEAGYRFTEEAFLRIDTMGVSQSLRYRTEGELNVSMMLTSFKFNLYSGLFSFAARGTVSDRILTLYAGPPGEEKKAEISLKRPIYLTASIFELSGSKELRLGERRIFYIFDPVTMGEHPVTVSALGGETFVHQGKSLRTRKLSLDFMGAEQFAWLDEEGSVLREKGIMGITLDKTTKKEALEGISVSSTADLTELASIRANKTIRDPEAIQRIRVKLSNVREVDYFLDGDRQTLRAGIVTIRKEEMPTSHRRSQIDKNSPFLKPEPMIQSNHPFILSKVKEIVSEADSDSEKAIKIVNWIYKNVKKRPVLSVPNALETLTNLVGDCNEHAVLLAAMTRAAGIPSEVEVGLVYMRGRFYYHAWNALYIGGWVTADAVLGQMPSDVTHIRFVRGTAERQMDLIGLISRVRLEILDFS
jgi:hypothetical protein